MSKFEILCVTMHQTDFSKIESMNIHSDVVFANQADRTEYAETEFEGHRARMITTATRGVGINRNKTLMYAEGDICLFADDDVTYVDNVESLVVSEFEAHPDADVIIFNLNSDDPSRSQRYYPKTKKCSRFGRMPWGGVRIAFRLSSIKKANVWFTTLFGGGCLFPSGEDSMWLTEARRRGLTFYVSKETIGTVSFETSTWFTGTDTRFYYGKGAFYEATHPKTFWLWMNYFIIKGRRRKTKLSSAQKRVWMKQGRLGYRQMKAYTQEINEKEH